MASSARRKALRRRCPRAQAAWSKAGPNSPGGNTFRMSERCAQPEESSNVRLRCLVASIKTPFQQLKLSRISILLSLFIRLYIYNFIRIQLKVQKKGFKKDLEPRTPRGADHGGSFDPSTVAGTAAAHPEQRWPPRPTKSSFKEQERL